MESTERPREEPREAGGTAEARGGRVFPLKALAFGVLLTLAAFCFAAFSAWSAHRAFRQIAERDLRLERLGGTIAHLDEVLTMSARMAAETGNPIWERRYRSYEPELAAAITEVVALAPDERMRADALATGATNARLVDSERRVFELVRTGRRGEAIRLLDGVDYQQDKSAYAASLARIEDGIRQRVDSELESAQQRTWLALVLVTSTLLALVAGWLAMLSAVRRHLDERGSLLAHLRAAVRARDDFISIATHELRTPLTALMLEVQILRRHARRSLGPVMEPEIDTVERQVRRLRSQVSTLLDAARIDSGLVSLTPEEDVDMCAVVRDVVQGLSLELSHAGCEVTTHGLDAPITGRWDRLRLEQVVSNLMTNALKYGRGKPIELEAHVDDERAVLAVRDHGIGMTPEQQSVVFERFERVATKERHAGFGLGLWIVRQIVAAMNGEVSVSSQPGEGATFRVDVPRFAAPVQSVA